MREFTSLTKAFSDPIRLRILLALRGGELCVGDLVSVIRGPQPTISRHLAYLRKAGLVSGRDKGQWIFYRLAPARTDFHKKLLDCLKHCFDGVSDVKTDSLRVARIRKSGGCCPD